MNEPGEPTRGVDPDPYPSGIYSTLPYPPVAEPPTPPARSGGARSGGAPSGGARSGGVGSEPAGMGNGARAESTADVLARIGDIDVTATGLRTPVGEVSLAIAVVAVTEDHEVRTPTWAMISAILGFFVVPVLSLVFLLARETVATGWVRVTVSGGEVCHETLVVDPAEIELARSLAAS